MSISTLAATDVVIAAGPVLGSVGISGLTLATGLVLLLGLRGSDRVSLDRDKAGGIGIGFGTLALAAGDLWGSVVKGISEVPTSLIQGGGMGNIGLGGIALALTILTFFPKWKRLIWPALLGISAGVIYGQAGGIWGIGVGLVLKLAGIVGAL
ncbi:hypothetical protein OG927_35875 (plasmid) [Streptomyces clavifer]|uniref:hypothetical protein n=1 Tax=Streptomyces clavifer TaxID=68188 RepID=UPI002E821C65|nr:hypothetical protein [Streptomyces clavifer]WUC32708.1 hypothetical protein OG927_35875 [Streptomyces clavifer]